MFENAATNVGGIFQQQGELPGSVLAHASLVNAGHGIAAMLPVPTLDWPSDLFSGAITMANGD
jgi:hypothetical protein